MSKVHDLISHTPYTLTMPILTKKEVGQAGLGLMRRYIAPREKKDHSNERISAVDTKFAAEFTWANRTVSDEESFAIFRCALATGVNVWNGAGTKNVDLFRPGRIDGKTPVQKTVKALADMVAEGLIGAIQLTEVNAEIICQASAVGKIDMVQTEINLWARRV